MDLYLLTIPHGFSQFDTSFFGSQCQGIPLAPFVAWPYMILLFLFEIAVYYLLYSIYYPSYIYFIFSWLSLFSFQGAFYLQAFTCLVGLSGLEPPTSRLSGVRSNRLSYKPIFLLPPAFQSYSFFSPLVEINGFEPLTPCLQSRCSPSWAIPPHLLISRCFARRSFRLSLWRPF